MDPSLTCFQTTGDCSEQHMDFGEGEKYCLAWGLCVFALLTMLSNSNLDLWRGRKRNGVRLSELPQKPFGGEYLWDLEKDLSICVWVCVEKAFYLLFPLLSIGHSLKINPLNDFVLETLRVQMGGECVGVSFRIAIKKPLCIDDDDTDIYCWHTQYLVAIFVLRSSRDESELRHPCYSPGPHLWNGWPLLGRKLMAGNHFLCAMLSAPCGHCCQRDDEILANCCSSQAAPNVLSSWGEVGKEKQAATGRGQGLPLFGCCSPAPGSCFCGCGDHAGSSIHALRQLLINPLKQLAGETLTRYAIKYLKKAVNLVFFWLGLQIYTSVALPKGQNQTRDAPRAHLSTLQCLLNILKIKNTLKHWALQKNKTYL